MAMMKGALWAILGKKGAGHKNFEFDFEPKFRDFVIQ